MSDGSEETGLSLAATYTLIYSFLKQRAHAKAADALRKAVKDVIVLKDDVQPDGPALETILKEWKEFRAVADITDDSSSDDDSSDDSSDSDSDDKEAKTSKDTLPGSKTTDDSDDDETSSDDDSSDEEDAKISAPKAKPSPAPKPVNLVRVPSGRDSSKTLSSADEDSDDSSSDDSSSSSEDATVLKKKKNVVASKKAATSSSSSSSSDDSSSNESKPAPKPASMPKKKPAVAAKEESSSEDSSSEDSSSEDSSSDEEDELETAVVKKAAASSSSSSPSEDSSDEDELEEDTSKPASKPTPSVDKAKASTSLDLEETKAVKKRRTGENGSSVVTATATPEPLRATESQGSAFQSKGGKGKPPRKSNTPFQRVKAEQTQIDHDELKDNSFESRRAGAGDYGERASRDLIVTRGDGFRKEKNKKKRGSYKGGEITMQSHSFRFPD